jgi:hypothetical protein
MYHTDFYLIHVIYVADKFMRKQIIMIKVQRQSLHIDLNAN